MRRLSTPGAGRKDYFLARYLPCRPGGGGRLNEIVSKRDRVRAVPVGSGSGPAAPGGRQAGTVPPMPQPREAAM